MVGRAAAEREWHADPEYEECDGQHDNAGLAQLARRLEDAQVQRHDGCPREPQRGAAFHVEDDDPLR